MSNEQLMQAIKTQWGAVIEEACKTSMVPAAFLAALIANETGGKADARRFEPHVLCALWEVLLGRQGAYGGIKTPALVQYVSQMAAGTVRVPSMLPSDAFNRLDALATSWGLTQIMGWHVLGTSHDLDDLRDPEGNLNFALRLFGEFAEQFQLDLSKDFEAMFRCWNGGHPTAQTFDTNYVPNGLARMATWNAL